MEPIDQILAWLTVDRVITVLGIGVAVYLYLKSRVFKRLECVFEPVAGFDLPIAATIQGRLVERFSVVRAHIRNGGTLALSRGQDVIKPVEIVFPDGTSILDARIIRQPGAGAASVAVSGSTVTCEFDLLNFQGDYISLQIILEGTLRGNADVRATVSGLRRGIVVRDTSRPYVEGTSLQAVNRVLLIANAILGITLILYGYYRFITENNLVGLLISLAVVVAGPLEDLLKQSIRARTHSDETRDALVRLVDLATTAAFLLLLLASIFLARTSHSP